MEFPSNEIPFPGQMFLGYYVPNIHDTYLCNIYELSGIFDEWEDWTSKIVIRLLLCEYFSTGMEISGVVVRRLPGFLRLN